MNGKRIAVIGHFMYQSEGASINGQTIKTKNIYDELVNRYGTCCVSTLDTNYFRKNFFTNYYKLFQICRRSKTILILPTENGLKLILPFLKIMKCFYRFKVLYPVIGGWLPDSLDKNRVLRLLLSVVDNIYPETYDMKQQLVNTGIKNIEQMPNFSKRKAINIIPEIDWTQTPYRLCTFSRVTKEKGITEAAEVITLLEKSGYHCLLDIYGPVDKNYQEELENILTSDRISYKGILNDDNIVSTLSEYHLMLFPSYYHGEGMPGAILDAFASGLPVVASDWHSNKEIVRDGYTGAVYELGDIMNLKHAVEKLLSDMDGFVRLKRNCLMEFKRYTPENVMKLIYDAIEQ